MPITINWITKIISVPQSFLDPQGGGLYELDLNDFRLALRGLEDDEEGIPFLITHRHNTEVTLGGLNYARVIEIINGYTVTFEDGQYAVSLIGANSNVADVSNVNQVSIRPNNSAGLISSKGIEALEYRDGVLINTIKGVAGTLYPIGTHRKPSNNLTDALTICNARGFHKIYIDGNFTFEATDNIDNYRIEGQGQGFTTLTIVDGCSCANTEFIDATLQGTLCPDDLHFVMFCNILNLTNFNGVMNQCIFAGTITLSGTYPVHLLYCSSGVAGAGSPIINMGGSGRDLNVRNYSGGIKITNLTANQNLSLDYISGQLKIGDDVTAGIIVYRGNVKLTENLGTPTYLYDYGAVNADIIKHNKEGNKKYEYIEATVQNDNRNVAVGKLDRYIIKIKNDEDSDWSSPISTDTLYMWYAAPGDDNPIYVGESD